MESSKAPWRLFDRAVLYTGGHRPGHLAAGSAPEPSPVPLPRLQFCLPLDRGKADPSKKGRGSLQPGTWMLTVVWFVLGGQRGGDCIARSHLELDL